MKRKSLVLLVSLGLLVCLFGASSAVFAYDTDGTVSLTRGGSSKLVTYDYVDTDNDFWQVGVLSVSMVGVPIGQWGNNSVTTRARSYDGAYPASVAQTFSSTTGYSVTYYNGYGGLGSWQSLYASMPSSASSTGCTMHFGFNA